jgi:hypothetical protein
MESDTLQNDRQQQGGSYSNDGNIKQAGIRELKNSPFKNV